MYFFKVISFPLDISYVIMQCLRTVTLVDICFELISLQSQWFSADILWKFSENLIAKEMHVLCLKTWLCFVFEALSFSTKYQRWNSIGSSTLNRHHYFNVVWTSSNIRRLNFNFQLNFSVETTLVHRRWINKILSTLFQGCFASVETTSINVCQLNFYFQPNINVETTWMNVDDQRCFNVDSTLMCFLNQNIHS